MGRPDYIESEYEFPKELKVQYKEKVLKVSGPKGEITKSFAHARTIDIAFEKNTITFSCTFPKRKQRSLMGTLVAHVKNMVRGVTIGPFITKMKIVYSHFPITVNIKGNEVLVENFLGERAPRRAKIFGNTKVKVAGDDVIVESINREDAGQTASNIRRVCKIKKKDPRTFQDGIFQYQKLLNNEVVWNLKY